MVSNQSVIFPLAKIWNYLLISK